MEEEPDSQINQKETESLIDISFLSLDSISFQEDANSALAAINERIETLESEGSYIKESIHHLEVLIKNFIKIKNKRKKLKWKDK